MRIKWFPPLDKFHGTESEVELGKVRTLGQLLARFQAETPEMAPYTRFSPEDKQPHGLMVWRNGTVLNLNDTLQPDDVLEMIIMVAGG